MSEFLSEISISKLVEMSRKYGSDEDYILAGGGNTSYKQDGVMAVKASGFRLGNIGADGFVTRLLQLQYVKWP